MLTDEISKSIGLGRARRHGQDTGCICYTQNTDCASLLTVTRHRLLCYLTFTTKLPITPQTTNGLEDSDSPSPFAVKWGPLNWSYLRDSHIRIPGILYSQKRTFVGVINLQMLREGKYPWLSRWSHMVTRAVCEWDRGRKRKRHHDGVMWPGAKECRYLCKLRKGMDFSLDPTSGMHLLILSELIQWPCISGFDFHALYFHPWQEMGAEWRAKNH